MESTAHLTSAGKPLVVAVLVCWLSTFPTAAAQTSVQGQDAVYNSSAQVTNSPAFIDASTFVAQSSDICDAIFNILRSKGYPPAGAVVDTRGINNNNSGLTCTKGSPWTEGSNTVNVPSTILLPAGTITIPSTWILPNNTKLIGEGYGTTGGTVILACTTSSCQANFQAGTSMIQFGVQNCSPGPICAGGISVENLHRQRWKSA